MSSREQSIGALLAGRGIPKWWPRFEGKAVRYLYRVNRADLSDYKSYRMEEMNIEHDTYEMRHVSCVALWKGSKFRSAFVHCAFTFHGAYYFYMLAQTNRGENSDRQSMVRIDILRWYTSMQHDDRYAFSAESFIDISDHTKQLMVLYTWLRTV